MKQRTRHTGVHSIDYFAYASKLSSWNASFKVVFSFVSLILCIAMNCLPISILFIFMMMLLIVCIGKLHIHDYLALLSIPAVFMTLSAITIAFNFARSAQGDFSCNFGLFYIYTTYDDLLYSAHLICKTFGAVSIMYFMTLTTPVCEIVGVLRRTHMPKLIIELMYLIYRFIFILLDVYGRMRQAAKSRLGYRDFRTSCRSFGGIIGNMLILSMRKANTYYDAMLSRCYVGEMQFLEPVKPIHTYQLIFAAGMWFAVVMVWLLTRG